MENRLRITRTTFPFLQNYSLEKPPIGLELTRKWRYHPQNSEYHVKLAETVEEACELLEVGFEYVTDMEGKKVFRKRK